MAEASRRSGAESGLELRTASWAAPPLLTPPGRRAKPCMSDPRAASPHLLAETKAAFGLCRGPGRAIPVAAEGEARTLQADVPAAGAGARHLLVLLGLGFRLGLFGHIAE